MKRYFFACAALLAAAMPASAGEKAEALKDHLESHVQLHGFIRNYFAFDTRESVAGTGDMFYWVPKDQNINDDGDDLNAQNQFRFLALTSRLWVEVGGYQIQNTKIGARVEADFYCGLTGVTGTAQFRLRQAFVTLGWEQAKSKETLKIGQAWHPMAADMPDVFSLNTGAPFGPFSRTPLAQLDANFGSNVGITAAAIWQQQYISAGPDGASANYMKYGCTPEIYFGVNVTAGGFLARAGVDMLSIAPRIKGEVPTGEIDEKGNEKTKTVKVNERITTLTPFLYLQYKTSTKVPFSVKAKTVLAQAGEHVGLNGGYGVSAINDDGSWSYTPTRNSSTWVSLSVGKKYQGVLFAGYVKNFGTKDELVDPKSKLYFSKTSFSNMNQMFRVTPTFMYNLGKFTVGVEYEATGIQYGKWDAASDDYKHGLATNDLHWILNHRVQGMVKFTF